MSPWRVLFSIDACSGLIPPVPRISVRFLSSWSLYVVSSMVSLVTSNHSTTTALASGQASAPTGLGHRGTESQSYSFDARREAAQRPWTIGIDEPRNRRGRFVD